MRFDDGHLRRVDHAVGVHLSPEIPVADRLTKSRFAQGDIAGVYRAVSVGVPDEQTHWDRHVGSGLVAPAIHAIEPDVDGLLVSNEGQRDSHHVSAHSNHAAITDATAPDSRYAHCDLRLRIAGHDNIVGEGNYHYEIVSATCSAAFNSRRARKR